MSNGNNGDLLANYLVVDGEGKRGYQITLSRSVIGSWPRHRRRRDLFYRAFYLVEKSKSKALLLILEIFGGLCNLRYGR